MKIRLLLKASGRLGASDAYQSTQDPSELIFFPSEDACVCHEEYFHQFFCLSQHQLHATLGHLFPILPAGSFQACWATSGGPASRPLPTDPHLSVFWLGPAVLTQGRVDHGPSPFDHS